jgi:hypothetical protein
MVLVINDKIVKVPSFNQRIRCDKDPGNHSGCVTCIVIP